MKTFAPGTLWTRIVQQTRIARETGVLRPIETQQRVIEDGGIPFLVSCVSSLEQKSEQKSDDETGGARAEKDPFQTFEPELFVEEVTDTHMCLLNKFNVIPHHALLVTKQFVPQSELPGEEDFRAVARCLADMEGLAFFNSGPEAGASQSHKHWQWIPLPLGEGPHPLPISAALDGADAETGTGAMPTLDFRHAFTRFEADASVEATLFAEMLLAAFHRLLKAEALVGPGRVSDVEVDTPYNVLVTREWMLLVPRRKECFEDVSINALAFAGSLFVKSEPQMQLIEQAGPMAVLRAVAFD